MRLEYRARVHGTMNAIHLMSQRGQDSKDRSDVTYDDLHRSSMKLFSELFSFTFCVGISSRTTTRTLAAVECAVRLHL